MLARKQEFNLKLNQILDAALLALAGWLAYVLRDLATDRFRLDPIEKFSEIHWIWVLVTFFIPLILELLGYYKQTLHKSPWRSLQQMFQAALYVGIAIGAMVIFQQWPQGPRLWLPGFAILGAAFLLIKEAVLRAWLRNKLLRGEMRERVILAGPARDIDRLLDKLPRESTLELDIVDRIDISTEPVETLIKAMHEKSVERVIFATAHVHFNKIEEAINACEIEGVEAWLWSDFIQTSIARPTFDAMGGRPMLVFRSTPEVSWALLVKSIIDIIGALFGLIILALVFIPVAIGIKLSSPGGPILFSQMRSGRHGKPFRMFKFRTMIPDAEARKKELEAQNQMSGPVFKIDRDPRIFPFGGILRKLSIDEWPQLINVLRGEMSLVGPRPLPVSEVKNISNTAQRRRLSVKPGLTCLWQISGRNQITDFDQWVALDLKYIDNWSIWLDLKILLLTVPVVLFARGAK